MLTDEKVKRQWRIQLTRFFFTRSIAADPAQMPLFTENDAGFRQLFAEKVGEGMRDGSVRADLDAEAMAVLLVGLLSGIALQLILTSPQARVEAIIDEAERLIRHALRGELVCLWTKLVACDDASVILRDNRS
jgi:hypothetical protein